jgi:hypothetical protein
MDLSGAYFEPRVVSRWQNAIRQPDQLISDITRRRGNRRDVPVSDLIGGLKIPRAL